MPMSVPSRIIEAAAEDGVTATTAAIRLTAGGLGEGFGELFVM
jgi:hypothetical protein